MSDRYICINLIYLLMALCLFFDFLYIVFRAKKKDIFGLIAKTLAALCFIIIGYFAYQSNRSSFNYFILLGLLLDGLGDLFLAFRNLFAKSLNFLIGSLCFISGHIMFIRALFLLKNDYLITSIIVAIFIAAALFYLLSKVCRFGKIYTIVGIAYTTIIMIMMCMTISTYITSKTISNLIFMVGAVLFVSSDIILILYNFSRKDKWMHPVYSALYFIAQLLISYSLHI